MPPKMPPMRNLTKASRMQADSLPEIRAGLNAMAFFDAKGHDVGNRPASQGHVINAALLALMAMPERDRKGLLARAFAALNDLMSLEEEPCPEELARILGGVSGGEDEAAERDAA